MSQTPATAQPISPLRRRMIEDMTIRGFGEKTQSDYIRHVKNFTIFLGRSPDLAEGEDLRAFQVRQREQGVQPPTMNGAVAALRFFFTTTCGRPEMARHLRLVKQPQKLPVGLTPEEVLLPLKTAPGPRYKAALGVAYGAGLRVSVVSNLNITIGTLSVASRATRAAAPPMAIITSGLVASSSRASFGRASALPDRTM